MQYGHRGNKSEKLKAMKRICLLLLLFFICLRLFLEFSRVIGEGYLLELLKGVSEAAIVGAMADWFAVVALFRHPLGLPIPHTAIIPKKKEDIAENVGQFFSSEFFEEQTVKEKLAGLRLIDRFFDLVEAQEKKGVISDVATKALNSIAVDIDGSATEAGIKNIAAKLVEKVDLSALIAEILVFLRKSGLLDKLLDRAVEAILAYIRANEEEWLLKAREKRWKFSPLKLLDDSYFHAFMDEVAHLLEDILKDRNHDLRQSIRKRTGMFIVRLYRDTELRARIDKLKSGIMNNPEVVEGLGGMWGSVKEGIIADTLSRDSLIKRYLHDAILFMAENYRTNQSVKEWLSSKQMALTDFLLARKDQLAGFISETIKKWDSKTISEKLELEIGTDLQFIRINGTIVGGIIGGVIATVSYLLK